MCFHEFYLSTACGHHFPKLPPSAKPNVFFDDTRPPIAVPQSLTCTPVKLALKFYHDQVVYVPADMNCATKVDMPKMCSIIHRPRDGPTKRTIREQEKAKSLLDQAMLRNGLGPWQKWQVENGAAILDQCSNRMKPGEHSPSALKRHKQLPYPLNMHAHVQSVKAFQSRDKRSMMPNVRYTNVDFGCGGPFSAECLTGWDGAGVLTHRLHLWGDSITHPKPCNHECLRGWSGTDLDTYRQQTWAGDDIKDWRDLDYPKKSRDHISDHNEHWVVINYSNLSDLHTDQYDWNGSEYVRRYALRSGQVVHVPEKVSVPVPESLDQVLRGLNRVAPPARSLPEESDRASIEDILGRLPEAFDEEQPLTRQVSKRVAVAADDRAANELLTEEGSEPPVPVTEGSESSATVVGDPEEQEPTVVETPEMAEARRRRAREVMREKLKRDFSEGKREDER